MISEQSLRKKSTNLKCSEPCANNSSSLIPAEVLETFKATFHFPQKPLCGVVASQHNVRMMRIYDFTAEGSAVLLTHTLSQKWAEFSACSSLAVAFVSEDKLTQVILKGQADLDSPETAPEKALSYWPLVRADVKKIYDPRACRQLLIAYI